MEKETLQKDVNALVKDIKIAADKVKEANKELESLNVQKVEARKELEKIKSLHQPLIDSLQEKIDSLKDLVIKNEREFLAEKQCQQEELASLDKQIEDRRQRVKNLEVSIDDNSLAVEAAVKELEKVKGNIPNAKAELKAVLDSIKLAKKELEETERLTGIKGSLIEEVKTLEKTRDEHLKRGLDLQKYASQLEEKDIELEKEKTKTSLLEQRLTPEYKKVFGRFANLKNNEKL